MNGVRKIMKKAKKSLLVLTSLGMASGVYVNELSQLNVVYAAKNHDGICEIETKSGEFSFNANGKEITTTKPMDLIQIIDLSGSLSDSEYKQRNGVEGARKQQINDMIYTIRTQLTDQDHVMLAFYGTNSVDSYAVEGQDGGIATRLLTKTEAINILTQINNEEQVHRVSQSWDLIPKVVKPLLDGYLADSAPGAGFEDVYMSQPNRNKVVSVLQFTDDWVGSEDIDSSFAAWAKANAKTFMTVVDNAQADSSTSTERMKAVGHPNIKVFRRLDEPNRQETIANLFKNTATEKVQPKTTINVTPDQGLTLKEVKLVSPDGKEENLVITNNRVNVEKDLPQDGKWTVKVKAEGLVHETKKVRATATIGGQEVGKTELVFEGCKDDVKGVDEERTKVNIDFKTNYIEDKNLPFGTEKVVTDGVIGIKEIIKTWNTVNGKRVGDPKVVEKMLQGIIDKVIARGVQKPKDFTYRVLDKDGKVLVDTTKVSQGYIGDKYKLEEVPNLEGYEVEKPEGVALDGTFKGENVNIDFVAYKLGKGVTLKTVTKDGKDLQAEQVLVEDNKRVGTEYTGKVSYEIKDKGRLYRLVALEQDSKPVDNKPVDNKPVDNKPADNKPADNKPADGKPVDNKPADSKPVDSKFDKDVDLKGSVSDVKIEYKAIYEEVKVGDVKVEFIDDAGKTLKSPVLLNTKDSLLGTDYKYDKEARLTVGSDTYALVKTTLEDKEVKEIKGQFDEKAKTYKLVYKKVVKPEPKKLPKTSSDNDNGSLGLFSTIVGLGVLLLGFIRKLVLK